MFALRRRLRTTIRGATGHLVLALACSGTAGAAPAAPGLPGAESAPAAAAPVPSDLLRLQGRMLYFKSCAHCHGQDLTGDEGPDLHALEISDRRIASVIKRGIKGEMPSFARKLNDADVAALVAFLRSLD